MEIRTHARQKAAATGAGSDPKALTKLLMAAVTTRADDGRRPHHGGDEWGATVARYSCRREKRLTFQLAAAIVVWRLAREVAAHYALINTLALCGGGG